jgi:hypothetical protein
MEIYTSTPTVSLGYDISGGGAPNTFTSTMFSLNRHKINYVKLTDPNVQDSSWPRFYKNYINVPYATTYIEPSKTIELNARMLSTG